MAEERTSAHPRLPNPEDTFTPPDQTVPQNTAQLAITQPHKVAERAAPRRWNDIWEGLLRLGAFSEKRKSSGVLPAQRWICAGDCGP